MSYILGADHAMLACLLHFFPAEADKRRPGETALQAGNDLGAVMVA
jgi:hypothetical protein